MSISYALWQLEHHDDQFDRLKLINAALWSLLKEKLDLSDDDLLQRMEELDLRDGVLDGEIRHVSQTCATCRRTMSERRTRCLYCGHSRGSDPFSA